MAPVRLFAFWKATPVDRHGESIPAAVFGVYAGFDDRHPGNPRPPVDHKANPAVRDFDRMNPADRATLVITSPGPGTERPHSP